MASPADAHSKSSEALLALEAASKLVAMIWASVLQQRCAL
ncbi:hypothetical protein C7S16_4799 [Burkholderia thailandensis]|uniref:Uncharacterized protein n=1 Tax=Burkholderia thailandensis TaxID=57975 RepID=A0AAW9CQR9_BURTH|nr:hypothetical protein [Burkholderia thailandensis]